MIRGIAEVTPYLYLSSANSACNQREVQRKDISFIVNATKNIGKQRFQGVQVVSLIFCSCSILIQYTCNS